jgi:hypothetical protein
MVGVEVGEEHAAQSIRRERRDRILPRRECRSANDPRAGIDEIGLIAGNDRDRGSGSLGIGVGCSGAENHHTSGRGGVLGAGDVPDGQRSKERMSRRLGRWIQGVRDFRDLWRRRLRYRTIIAFNRKPGQLGPGEIA